MDYVVLIVSGLLIGLIVAVPIGPVNLICIRRTLAFGSLNGFVAGMGAAAGDGIFAIVTGFGLTAVSQLIEGFSFPLELSGGALLLYFGWRTFFNDPHLRDADKLVSRQNGRSSLAGAMASTFALTITNPATLLAFAGLIAGFGGLAGARQPSFVSAAFVVAGVIGGSTAWWLALTTVVGLLHARIDDYIMHIINRVSGFLIAGFGVAVLTHLLLKLL
jgi:threonine/homoserine/homoserine lactone efflux protein